ncbi:unnamed protein product [Protopolystoma xenopodis]|uniref:Uncharacterized protein n=1 Tax=Protopolystoma xenopodis TaxID=117903 RepID=A0A3S5A6V3_9PLAT|nr:unnamed protein product [Protopolystoma xenopodis]
MAATQVTHNFTDHPAACSLYLLQSRLAVQEDVERLKKSGLRKSLGQQPSMFFLVRGWHSNRVGVTTYLYIAHEMREALSHPQLRWTQAIK